MLCPACSRDGRAEALLRRADSLMEIQPDSSSAILDSIPLSGLSDRQQAIRGLLMAKADMRTGKRITDDSLIAQAARYFADGHDSLTYQSLYYYGISLRAQDSIADALLTLARAEALACADSAFLYLARIQREEAEIYAGRMQLSDAYPYSVDSYKNFEKAQMTLHSAWAVLTSANILMKLGHYYEADSLLNNVSSEFRNSSVNLNTSYLINKAYNTIHLQDYNTAEQILDSLNLYIKYISDENLLLISNAYALSKNFKKAQLYRNLITDKSDLTSSNLKYNEYLLRLGEFGFDSIADLVAFVAKDNITAYEMTLTSDVEKTIKDNLKLQIIYKEQARKNTLRTASFIIIILLLTIILISLLLRNIRQKQLLNLAIAQKLNVRIKDLEKSLSDNIATNKLIPSYKAIAETNIDTLRVMVQNGSALTTIPDNEKLQQKRIQHFLDDIKNDKIFEVLRMTLNIKYDNIFSRFMIDFPNLSDLQIKLIILTFARFSRDEISFLLNKNPVNISSLKNKIKTRIVESDSPYKSEYLNFFGAKKIF